MELQAAVALFRRRSWIIVLAFVVGIVAAAAYSSSKPTEYSAGARVFVFVENPQNVQAATQGFQFTSQLITTFARVATSEKTTTLVAEKLNNAITPGEVRAKVTADTVPQTTLIEIRARDQDPVLAANLANATASALQTVVEDLGKLSTGGVKASVIDQAHTPRKPVSPKPKRDISVGGLLGLAIGAAAAMATDALDRTIREAEVASDIFGAPVLCSIPKQRKISSDPLVALKSGGSPTGEAYRALRTTIRFRESSQHLKTVLVTSAAAGDGKSTIAANLAIAMSLDGARTILIDADLRRTRLASMFGIPEGKGLTDVLLGKSTLADALVPWSRGLSILQVGTYTLNPSEALGSQVMRQVLEEAKQLADIVIVDAPPILPVADPVVLAALVDGTVLVCRWHRTSLHAASATRSMLENVGADVIGVVLNAEGGGRSANYYRHYSTRPLHRRNESSDRKPPAAPPPATNGAANSANPESASSPAAPHTDAG